AEAEAIMTMPVARTCRVQSVCGSVDAMSVVPMSFVRIRGRYGWTHRQRWACAGNVPAWEEIHGGSDERRRLQAGAHHPDWRAGDAGERSQGVGGGGEHRGTRAGPLAA